LLRAYGARLSTPRAKQSEDPLSLDLSQLAPEIAARLVSSLGPAVGNLLGVDLTRDTVSVHNRAVTGLGGLWVDVHGGNGSSAREHATSIPGLYAAGSATAEYHGAACLSGNLAPADLLGARRAARGAIAYRAALEKSAFDLPKSVFEKRATVRGTNVGWNQDALLLASLPDSLAVARCIASAALAREESRGAHLRTDFTATRDEQGKPSWLKSGAGPDPEPLESFEYECAGETVSIAR